MICLDSTFIIDYFRGDEKAKNLLFKLDKDFLFTTEITLFEVGFGMINTNKKNFDLFTKFIERIKIIPATTFFSLESAKIKKELESKGRKISSMDLLILGMMRSYGIKKIVTRNSKHFEGVEDISVINY